MRSALVIFVLVLASIRTASAEPVAPGSPVDQKTPDLGVLLTAVGIAAPAVLIPETCCQGNDINGRIALGTIVAVLAPSAGHWYAGELWSRGLYVRLAGAGIVGIGLLDAAHGDNGDNATALFVTGVTVGIVGALLDFADSGDAVQRWNRAHATRVQTTMIRTDRGYGVGVAGRF